MSDILHFPRHVLSGSVLHPCDCEEDGGWTCIVCAGGLAYCVACGGAESSMPTHCPGYIIEEEVLEAVSAGEVDYDWRHGWIRRDAAWVRTG